MKNLKLSTKLFLLSAFVCFFLLLTGFVGWSRLRMLNENTQLLGQKTFANVIKIADLRSNLFATIRAQKNAVISNDDAESNRYADASEAASAELLRMSASLESTVNDILAKDLNVAIMDLVKVNQECLDMARLNTIVKANDLLKAKILPSIEAVQEAVDKSSNMPVESLNESTFGTMMAIQKISRCATDLYAALVTHVATPTFDKPAFAAADADAKKKRDALFQAIDNCKDPDLKSNLQRHQISLQADVERFIRWSTEDSNNISVRNSLTGSKEKTDKTLTILDSLTRKLREDANAGVKTSGDIYVQSGLVLLVTSLIGLAISVTVSWLVSRSVSRSVSLVKNLSQEMADGNLMSRINLNQTDEVGELASATDSLADALTGIVSQIQKASEHLGLSSTGLGQIANSLVSQSEQTSLRASGVSAASEQLSTNISTMSSAAEEMSMNFASISAATEEMSVSVGSISSAAEQTSSNVSAVAGAIHDITASFDNVLASVRTGARVASNASEMADSANTTMNRLDQSSIEISKVTETIKMIALQTNLLALNATIEATSAGEAGKGFAVVAHEIKQLANQSAKAAEDIAIKIEGVQTGTRQAVGVIQQIASVIREINSLSDRISASVEHQSKAAQTISQNIGQANSGVSQIARSISEVAATANDMSRNIAEATRGATDVSRNVGEAAKAAGAISDSITEVSQAAEQTNQSSGGVSSAASTLSNLSLELTKLVSRFRIPTHGS